MPDPDGGHWLECRHCDEWRGDAFEYYCAYAGHKNYLDGIHALKALKVRVHKSVTNSAILRNYTTYVKTRKHIEHLFHRMSGRAVASASTFGFGLFSIQDKPHHHPLWWCMQASEFLDIIHNKVDKKNIEHKLNVNPYDPILVVPAYDKLDRVCGLSLLGNPETYNESTSWVWYSLTGSSSGLAFKPTGGSKIASWGNKGIITDSLGIGINLHSSYIKDNPGNIPVLTLVGDPSSWYTTVYNSLPQNIEWVIVTNKSRPIAPELYKLARRLNCNITTQLPNKSIRYLTAPTLFALSKRWDYALCDVLATKMPNDIQTHLAIIGWNTDIADKLKQVCTVDTWSRISSAMESINLGVEVEIRKGFTIYESEEGWVRLDNGLLLSKLVPTITRIYKRANGRIHHAGIVRCSNNTYTFDSALFRKDPWRVIERVVVSGGGVFYPPHPSIVKNTVDICLYLSSIKKSITR